MKKIKRVGILTSGGDCPGLNAVIRAVVRKSISEFGYEMIGVEDGFEGLIYNRHRMLKDKDVSGILTLGGTILGTSNRANPYKFPIQDGRNLIFKDMSHKIKQSMHKLRIDCLVCIGGDGSLGIADRLCKAGVPIIGIPKTIDNNVLGTDITFGFDTAVHIATDGVDRLRTTAESHHRVMILEVMGRTAGWIGLYVGVAGGADTILIPEIPYDISTVAQCVKERHRKGRKFTLVVVAEGAKPQGGDVVIKEIVKDASEPIRLGGISFVLGKEIERSTGVETRNVVMGHLQRGGSPSPVDRILGTQLGVTAVDFIARHYFGFMVGVQKGRFVKVPLAKVGRGQRLVPHDHALIKTAQSLGVCFGYY